MNKLLFFVILSSIPALVSAQNIQSTDKSFYKVNSYKESWKKKMQQWKETGTHNRVIKAGFTYNTNGWGTGITYGTGRGNKQYFTLGVAEIRHAKEVRIMQSNTGHFQIGKRTPFVFGKINHVYLVQLGWGKDLYLFPALLNGNISLGLNYSGGFSLAASKPYYLNYIDTDPHTNEKSIRVIKYTPETDEDFLSKSNILGAHAWKKGLNELTVSPGFMGNISLFMEASNQKRFSKRLVMGTNLNYHLHSYRILAENKAFSFSPYLFVGMEMGIQWSR